MDEHGTPRWIPPNITWDRIDWLRSVGELVVKGIRNVEGAMLCVTTAWTASSCPTMAEGSSRRQSIHRDTVSDRSVTSEVYFDSGVRSGLDVFRALALGARAVFVVSCTGAFYGGEAGVALALEIMMLDRLLAFSGCRSIDSIGREHVLVG